MSNHKASLSRVRVSPLWCLTVLGPVWVARAAVQSHVGRLNATDQLLLWCEGQNGPTKWEKRVNGTFSLIAVNGSVTGPGGDRYPKPILKPQKNGNQTLLRTILVTNHTDLGMFRCTFGNDSQVLHVPMTVTTSSGVGNTTVQLCCGPPPDQKQGPFTIIWFVNSTLVARTHHFPNGTVDIHYETNVTFVERGNFTVQGDRGYYNGTMPGCLTCVVTNVNGYGSYTKCTHNAKNVFGDSHLPVVHRELGLGSSNEGDPGDVAGPPTAPSIGQLGQTGAPIVVIVVCCIAMFLLLVLIIHVTGRRYRYRPRRPDEDLIGRRAERPPDREMLTVRDPAAFDRE